MSEREESHDSHVDSHVDSEGEEVIFREGAAAVENSTASTAPTASPQMVTKSDLEEVIEGWKIKYHQLSEGIRAIQMASEKFNTNMDNARRGPGTPNSRYARSPCALSREMQPRTPRSSAPF